MGNMSGSYGSHYTLRQSITQNSQNINNNTTNVTVRLYLGFDGSSYYAFTNNTSSGNMVIDGNTYNYSIPSISFSSGQAKEILLAEWNGDIKHNEDGRRDLSVSGYWNTNTSRIGSGNTSSFATLNTIPRASGISCTTANVGEPALITVSSASGSFTHDVWFDFGSLIAPYKILTNVSGGIYSWTIPEEFYAQMPKSKSKTGRIYCRTYSNGQEIGLKAADFTVTTNEEKCKPTLEATVKDINEATIALTGDENKFIKYRSTAQISISTSSKNSATIVSKKINNIVVTTDINNITNIETNIFDIVSTDSRGYSTLLTLNPETINYIPLSINAVVRRIQPTTGEVGITFTGNYFNGTFGTTGEGTGFTVGDTINSSDISCNFPENLYVEIQNLGLSTDGLKLLETDKYTLYAGVLHEAMNPVYGIYFRDNSTREWYDLYYASYYEPIEGYKISTNVSSASEAFGGDVDLGTITYVSEDTTFMKYIFNGELVDNNNSLSIIWQYKEKDSEEWIEGGELTPVISDNTFSSNSEIVLGDFFDYQKSYNIKLEVVDKLTTLNPIYSISQGIPIFNWGKEFLNVNGDFRIKNRSVVSYFGEVLYENSQGSNGNITIDEDWANFSFIEVFAHRENAYEISVKFQMHGDNTKGKIIETGGNYVYFSTLQCVGKEMITNNYSRAVKILDATQTSFDTNIFFITKIVGYR